jgi:hypothetical protein
MDFRAFQVSVVFGQNSKHSVLKDRDLRNVNDIVVVLDRNETAFAQDVHERPSPGLGNPVTPETCNPVPGPKR